MYTVPAIHIPATEMRYFIFNLIQLLLLSVAPHDEWLHQMTQKPYIIKNLFKEMCEICSTWH